jgi:hypothetical protein
VTVTNCTFSENSSGEVPGSAVFGQASLKSTIMANSSLGSNCFETVTDAGYNISDDTSCGFSATSSRNNTDPMLDRAGLSNNDGPTHTIALLDGSPAIDAIPPGRVSAS